MYELKPIHGTDKATEIKNKLGGFNDFPPGWREITQKEFVNSDFFIFGFLYKELRQMLPDQGLYYPEGLPRPVSATLYHFQGGGGVAMVPDHSKGTVSYFAFGCKHSYQTLTQEVARERGIPHFGNCYHVNECTKCGNIFSYDSGD